MDARVGEVSVLWLSVLNMPDGITIEIAMPSVGDPDQPTQHEYRVRDAKGVVEFSTLTEVGNHVRRLDRARFEEDAGTGGADDYT
jgi:hypothetical protein